MSARIKIERKQIDKFQCNHWVSIGDCSCNSLWVRIHPSKTNTVNNKSYCPFVNHLLNCRTVLYSFCLTNTIKNNNEVLRSNSNKWSSGCNHCTFYLFCRVEAKYSCRYCATRKRRNCIFDFICATYF